ncbi:hypothetical protein ACJX0J_036997 [Zea mays]
MVHGVRQCVLLLVHGLVNIVGWNIVWRRIKHIASIATFLRMIEWMPILLGSHNGKMLILHFQNIGNFLELLDCVFLMSYEEMGDCLFTILVDESRDISIKEQMALVIEKFLGLKHLALLLPRDIFKGLDLQKIKKAFQKKKDRQMQLPQSPRLTLVLF